MFTQKTEFDFQALCDFIEKPSTECDQKALENGVELVLLALEKNPPDVMRAMTDHPFIGGSYLLADLADKMKMQKCLEFLDNLFKEHLNQFIKECVYNRYDLKRCVDSIPELTDKIMTTIFDNQDYTKRIFNADNNPEDTLNEMIKDYPQHKDLFTDKYNYYFNKTTLSL